MIAVGKMHEDQMNVGRKFVFSFTSNESTQEENKAKQDKEKRHESGEEVLCTSQDSTQGQNSEKTTRK